MTARDDCESCGATSADKCVCGVHSCGYECDRPACVRRQRDELQRRVAELEANDRRYRWLREHLVNWCPNDGTASLSWHAREVLDCIIDTSILADREGGKT